MEDDLGRDVQQCFRGNPITQERDKSIAIYSKAPIANNRERR